MSFLYGLLYAILTTLIAIAVLHGLSIVSSQPIFSFVSRILASVFCLILCATYGVFASIFLRITGYGGLSQWTVARSFKWTMWALTGITFPISDPHNALRIRPAVFVGNHQSELDILMLACMFPPYCSVTSKASLKYWPFLGWFMLLSKTVFINRANNKEARSIFAEAVKTMQKDKQSVYLFPEGTRSYAKTPELLPFKKGAFHLAVQAGVPIVPLVAANYSWVLDMKERVFTAGSIPISVLPAIETAGLKPEDVNNLVGRVEKMMKDELVRISSRTNGKSPASNGSVAGKMHTQ